MAVVARCSGWTRGGRGPVGGGSMRRHIAAFVFLLSLGVACHAPVTITTPQGKIAYTADQIVQRVNELENAAIKANGAGQLSLDTTRIIVEFCVGADKTLAQTPAGWQASVQAAWTAARAKIPTTNPAIASAVSAVDVVLAIEGGQ